MHSKWTADFSKLYEFLHPRTFVFTWGNTGEICPGWCWNAWQSYFPIKTGNLLFRSYSHILFLKHFITFLYEDLLNIVNYSLQMGVFPTALKTAIVKPLLKRSNLDASILDNYRPVSNLPFLNTILEKLVFNQLNDFMKNLSILVLLDLSAAFDTVDQRSPTFFCATDRFNVRQYFHGPAFEVRRINTTN